jgi:4-amino-4-deoxy-L-arabinose transferase-like glycosyltransferase
MTRLMQLITQIAGHVKTWHIFTVLVVLRAVWVFLSGFDRFELNNDSGWILRLMNETGKGVINYDIGRFIVSPLYPFTGGLLQIALGPWWLIALMIVQVALAAWSGVWLYRLALTLFSKETALVTVVLFALFPLTFWWTGTLASESPFQSLLIGTIYFLVKYTRTRYDGDLIVSVVCFSLAYLTKSHILLFAPFIALYLWKNKTSWKEGLFAATGYAAVSLLFSLPYGYHTLKSQGTYVISSNGGSFHFYTGNSPFGYRSIVDIPERGTAEFNAMQAFEFTPFNGPRHDSLMALPQKMKQRLYLEDSFNWIRSNPGKFAELKVYNAAFFLMPGVSWRHYGFGQWLATFAMSLPIYILAYLYLLRLIKRPEKEHLWVVYLFVSMLIFSVVFYVQNRFRTITLEPFYLLYAAEGIRKILSARTAQATQS